MIFFEHEQNLQVHGPDYFPASEYIRIDTGVLSQNTCSDLELRHVMRWVPQNKTTKVKEKLHLYENETDKKNNWKNLKIQEFKTLHHVFLRTSCQYLSEPWHICLLAEKKNQFFFTIFLDLIRELLLRSHQLRYY